MRTVTKSQKVDVFIHCAGVYRKVPLMADYDADAAHVLNTNLVTPVLLLRRVITAMIQRGTGTIAVINSLAGKQGNAEEAAYCASKFGLRGFVESVRYDCAKSGVRIFSVYPGAMQTPMAKGRDNFDKLVQPRKVAELLVDICLKYHTLRVDDIEIMRTTY
jgi:short-subunit dehydrogenase